MVAWLSEGETPIDGDGWAVARGEVMLKVLTRVVRGWRGVEMTEFWRMEVVPNSDMMAKFKGTPMWDWI